MVPPITVFYWVGSPWASKVVAYLSLRKIPYTECHQPITMPRPILADLGVKYRRIPVVSIGKDIYCDTLLIIEKLEELFPSSLHHRTVSGQTAEQKALDKLLEKWTDTVVFGKAADCIPLDHPLVQDPKFIKDRSELWGENWDRSAREKKRPDGLVAMRAFFDFLESTLLADGRQWVLGTSEPTTADIHSAWIFNWMLSLEGSFPDNIVSTKTYPKVIAWCGRYQNAIDQAQEMAKPEVVEGDEAIKRIEASEFAEDSHGVDEADPLSLKEGQEIMLAPTDTGSSGKVTGPLVAVTKHEIVVASKTKNGTQIHIHTPRWNFSATPAETNGAHAK